MPQPPSHIRAHQGEQVLELGWDGEPEARVAYREIRGQCPCASCRDEWTGQRILDVSTLREDLKLAGMEPVGNYAVRLSWNDGHSSGLFTWALLRELAVAAGQARWQGMDPPEHVCRDTGGPQGGGCGGHGGCGHEHNHSHDAR